MKAIPTAERLRRAEGILDREMASYFRRIANGNAKNRAALLSLAAAIAVYVSELERADEMNARERVDETSTREPA